MGYNGHWMKETADIIARLEEIYPHAARKMQARPEPLDPPYPTGKQAADALQGPLFGMLFADSKKPDFQDKVDNFVKVCKPFEEWLTQHDHQPFFCGHQMGYFDMWLLPLLQFSLEILPVFQGFVLKDHCPKFAEYVLEKSKAASRNMRISLPENALTAYCIYVHRNFSPKFPHLVCPQWIFDEEEKYLKQIGQGTPSQQPNKTPPSQPSPSPPQQPATSSNLPYIPADPEHQQLPEMKPNIPYLCIGAMNRGGELIPSCVSSQIVEIWLLENGIEYEVVLIESAKKTAVVYGFRF